LWPRSTARSQPPPFGATVLALSFPSSMRTRRARLTFSTRIRTISRSYSKYSAALLLSGKSTPPLDPPRCEVSPVYRPGCAIARSPQRHAAGGSSAHLVDFRVGLGADRNRSEASSSFVESLSSRSSRKHSFCAA
jgi:hypothetical protein